MRCRAFLAFFEPGEIVLYTGTPSRALEPLDEAARVAKAAAERSYELLPNGVQTRDRRTGSMRNVRFGGA